MQEQSWMYDRLIRFGGPDFYWPMTQEVLNASGMTGWGDVMSVRAGVRRMADLTREMPLFLLAHFVVLCLLTFIPELSTWLPHTLGFQ
jgi:hypothetical protein